MVKYRWLDPEEPPTPPAVAPGRRCPASVGDPLSPPLRSEEGGLVGVEEGVAHRGLAAVYFPRQVALREEGTARRSLAEEYCPRPAAQVSAEKAAEFLRKINEELKVCRLEGLAAEGIRRSAECAYPPPPLPRPGTPPPPTPWAPGPGCVVEGSGTTPIRSSEVLGGREEAPRWARPFSGGMRRVRMSVD